MSLSAPGVIPEVESSVPISEAESHASIEPIAAESGETSVQKGTTQQMGCPSAAWHDVAERKEARVYTAIRLPWELSLTYASKMLWVVIFIAGEKVARLLSPSWVMHALCMLPFDFCRSFSLGWLYVVFVQPAFANIASMLLFSTLWSLGAAILKTIGQHRLSSAANGAAMILWAIVTLPCSKRKLSGVLVLAWGLLINVVLVTTLTNFQEVKHILPRGMHGLAMPCIVGLYDAVGCATIAWIWRHYTAAQDIQISQLLSYVFGQVISTAETLRVVGVLSVIDSEEWVKELIFNMMASAAFDCLGRTSVILKFCSWLMGWTDENSPERELQLRARFAMSYVSFFVLAVGILAVICVEGVSWPWELCLLLLAALLNELLSDLCCLVCLRRRGESLLATFHRLQSPGGHQRLQFYGLARFASIHPTAFTPSAKLEDTPDSLTEVAEGRLCRVLGIRVDTMGWWLLLSYAGVMLDIGVASLLGSCGWSLSEELCEHL
mmetsp:Transcript_95578/g.270247  ORF Transcript_95578/g.270247 Transcript_95578/m.270247 type:complete len:494 (+) Transcript_95578:81-1562(+)